MFLLNPIGTLLHRFLFVLCDTPVVPNVQKTHIIMYFLVTYMLHTCSMCKFYLVRQPVFTFAVYAEMCCFCSTFYTCSMVVIRPKFGTWPSVALFPDLRNGQYDMNWITNFILIFVNAYFYDTVTWYVMYNAYSTTVHNTYSVYVNVFCHMTAIMCSTSSRFLALSNLCMSIAGS